jgi:hypothetical protein
VSALQQLCEVQVLESGAAICVPASGPLLEMALSRLRKGDPGAVSEAEAKAFLTSCLSEDAANGVVACDSSAGSRACAALTGACAPGACGIADSTRLTCCLVKGASCERTTSAGLGACQAGGCLATGGAASDLGGAIDPLKQSSALPSGFRLAQNSPNPFNPTTDIEFTLPAAMQVRLEVFNTLGRRVRTLLEGSRSAGSHTLTWDARGEDGQPVPSGSYLYRLTAGQLVETRTMTLLR